MSRPRRTVEEVNKLMRGIEPAVGPMAWSTVPRRALRRATQMSRMRPDVSPTMKISPVPGHIPGGAGRPLPTQSAASAISPPIRPAPVSWTTATLFAIWVLTHTWRALICAFASAAIEAIQDD